MELATWVTAIGTLALALATFVYVRQTSRVTRAAETSASAAEAAAQHAARTAALAERALLADVMPLLVADF